MTDKKWAVYRQDFTGNEFLVEKNLGESRAKELVEEFESHKHHQHYWACPMESDKDDFVEMLRTYLAAGSSIIQALTVLRNQGANNQQCLYALSVVKKMETEEAKYLLREIDFIA